MPAIYFDQEADAEPLLAQLHAEGYRTTFTPEAFAGEDDSADRSWVLVVEPFDQSVIEMVDVYGGWLAGDDRRARDIVDLPDEPRKS
jgi:hypothetical protein